MGSYCGRQQTVLRQRRLKASVGCLCLQAAEFQLPGKPAGVIMLFVYSFITTIRRS
jgi:hypothetical protein